MMSNERELAAKILMEFEDFLADKGVSIPNVERDGVEDGAILFGTDYYNLEDSIVELLKNEGVDRIG